MAKKHNDYLANLLANDAGKVTVPASPTPATSRAGISLLGRETALARVASGEVKQVTQLLIDPARVKIWAGNARIQNVLTEENCKDLIDSILAEGGQKIAVTVRHLKGDPNFDYELIAGSRRHFAVSWLRANNYPDIKLLAHVVNMDDEAAFRFADIENRARKDISIIERAKNYAAAIDQHYGGKANRMAERLHLSKGWLSKMLKAATLPDTVLSAFSSLDDLGLNPAYKLAVAMDDPQRAKSILKEAKILSSKQVDAASALPAGTVLQRLLNARTTEHTSSKPDLDISIPGNGSKPILSVKTINRHGVTLHLPLASGASDQELATALVLALEELRKNGISVQ